MQIYGRVLALTLGILIGGGACAAQAHDRALVVGVNEYPALISGGVAGGINLSGAVPDAKTFVGLLVDVYKFNQSDIKLLTDAEATKANVLGAIQDWLIDGSGPGDRVVFYFSGHGATVEVEDSPGHKHTTSTLVPSDAKADLDKAPLQVEGMIEGKTIGELLQKLVGRHVTVVADSCHSGSVTRDLAPSEKAGGPRARTITPHVPAALRREDVTRQIEVEAKTDNHLLDTSAIRSGPADLEVWTAATLAQETFDLPGGAGGIFTQSFAQGLRDKKAAVSAGGEVTAQTLLHYVQAQAATFCQEQAVCSAGLTPQLDAPDSYKTSVLNPLPSPHAPPPPPPHTEQTIAADAVNIFTHHNDFPLTAEILPSAQVTLGQSVRFRVTSGAPGTLIVLDTGPDGKLRQIFPNEDSAKNNVRGHVNANAPITIPDKSYGFDFTATDAGPGTLLVLVAEQAVDLSGILGRNLDFKPVANAREILVEIADKVDAPKISADLTVPNGSFRYAFVTVPYVVQP